MARPSNRIAIVEAAVRVATRKPITPVTIEAVAGEAGLTKAGVLYHFPTKVELLIAVQEQIARTWEAQLVAAAGGPAETVPLPRRVAAYARVAAETASRAELALLLEASADPAIAAPIDAVTDRWVPSVDAALDDPTLWPLVVVRLAADGLWLGEGQRELPMAARSRIAAAIAAIAEPEGPGGFGGGERR